MYRRVILCAVASAAAIISTAAVAQRGGGGGGGMGGGMGNAGGMGGGMGNAGGMGGGLGGGLGAGAGGMNNSFGIETRDASRINSQGPAHASANGIANANSNSVLAGTTTTRTVKSGALTGLTTGTTLFSNGTAVGTVQQIRMTGNGSVAVVIVKATNGGLYAVPANKLTFSGGMLSTSSRLAGVNTSTNVAMNSQARLNSQGPLHASATGIAHANSHSVLAGAPSTALTGISVGMPLFSNGTQVGTVFRVVTVNGIITRVLVQGTSGRVFSLAPRTLTASGGTVMTTATLRGL